MKLTLKLLILIAILVAVAGLCGGWKWDAMPGKRKATDYALVAVDPNSPADPNASASSPPTDAPSHSRQPTRTAQFRAHRQTHPSPQTAGPGTRAQLHARSRRSSRAPKSHQGWETPNTT